MAAPGWDRESRLKVEMEEAWHLQAGTEGAWRLQAVVEGACLLQGETERAWHLQAWTEEAQLLRAVRDKARGSGLVMTELVGSRQRQRKPVSSRSGLIEAMTGHAKINGMLQAGAEYALRK